MKVLRSNHHHYSSGIRTTVYGVTACDGHHPRQTFDSPFCAVVIEPQRRHHVADARSIVLVLILDFM